MAPSEDPRFARLHTDPRFRRPKQKNLKVEIDERFRDVLEGEDFGGGKSKSKGKGVDKRGRPLNQSHHADQLKRFYRLRSASPEQEGFVDYARGQGALPSSGSEDEDDSDEDGESSDEIEELEIGGKKNARLPKYDLDEDESDESESGESHLDIDLSDEEPIRDRADKVEDGDVAEIDAEEEEEALADPTTRVAAVNLDWDNLRAVDLFSVFNSFLNSSPGAGSSKDAMRVGKLVNVRIYPSDFGKGRMAMEEREGPGGGIFATKFDGNGKRKTNVQNGDEVEDDDDEESDDDEEDDQIDGEDEQLDGEDDQLDDNSSDDENLLDEDEEEDDEEEVSDEEMEGIVHPRKTYAKKVAEKRAPQPTEIDGLEIVSDVSSDNEEGDVNMDQLRQYQLERLRYFYAVATFSTVEAAMKVVAECQGTEFERTANVLDLSYVPDEMTFADEDIKDEATKELRGYKGNDFITDALRHSKVKLTWDQDDPNRSKMTRRTLTKEEMEEHDFNAYVASSGSDTDDEDPTAAPGLNGGTSAKGDKKSRKNQLRNLLLEGEDDSGDVWGKAAWGSKYHDVDSAGPSSKRDGDMEITFKPALSGAAGNTNEEEMTTLEKYQMRIKEKKARKKEKVELKRAEANDEDGKQAAAKVGEKDADDFFGDDESDDQLPAEHGRRHGEMEEDDVDEDEDDERLQEIAGGRSVEHFSMRDILKSEKEQSNGKKRKRSKKKRGRNEERDVELGPQDWKIDVKDSRFKALHEEPDFAIDPSNPRFQKTKAMSDLLDERNRHRKSAPLKVPANAGRNPTMAGASGKGDLSALVQSVKQKMAQNRGRKRVKKHA